MPERRSRVALAGRDLTTATWGPGTPSIVVLHDGLGSIEGWGAIPARVSERAGATVMAYDRPGHGRSRPTPRGAWPPDWMSQEADLLAELLGYLDVSTALLVGHSDGASIALLHAAGAGHGVAGVLALAPHSYVEPRCTEAIGQMRRRRAAIVTALSPFHENPDAIFDAWSLGWTSSAFASWDIRHRLNSIAVPTWVVQGSDDAYATAAMASDTAEAVGDNATSRLLVDRGHLLPREDPDLVVDLVADLAAVCLP